MIRLVLFILVICISGLNGFTESKKVLHSNQPQFSQPESSPKFDFSEHPALHIEIFEKIGHEPNTFLGNHKQFSSSDQFADGYNIIGSYNERSNLFCLIRKDYFFFTEDLILIRRVSSANEISTFMLYKNLKV
jgi:hypothetical protein